VSTIGADSDKITKPAGSKTILSNPSGWRVGDTLCYIKTASGSVSFASLETGA
jgi:hypothetical protein